jgi:hypothetical protein
MISAKCICIQIRVHMHVHVFIHSYAVHEFNMSSVMHIGAHTHTNMWIYILYAYFTSWKCLCMHTHTHVYCMPMHSCAHVLYMNCIFGIHMLTRAGWSVYLCVFIHNAIYDGSLFKQSVIKIFLSIHTQVFEWIYGVYVHTHMHICIFICRCRAHGCTYELCEECWRNMCLGGTQVRCMYVCMYIWILF